VAAYFLDTSTIVKRYAQEIGTAWVQGLTAPAVGHLLAVVRVAQAETVAAVTRKERGRLIIPQAATAALADFTVDFAIHHRGSNARPGRLRCHACQNSCLAWL
jgi:uncharacterized protein